MNDICSCLIEVCGRADEGEVNAISPLHVRVVRAGPETTLLSVCTDQSGLIGLLRHLHGLGFVFLSVNM